MQHIAPVALEATPGPAVDGPIDDLNRLASLADAIRNLQRLDGTFVHESAAKGLLHESAALVRGLARSPAISEDAGTVLEARASALTDGCGYERAARLEGAGADPQPLTVICGPLCTWRLKTATPLHSLVAATWRPSGNRLVADADQRVPSALAEVRARTGLPQLEVTTPYPLHASDVVACGGEANAFPKHFAYFLPEDEGVSGATKQKTLVFQNVYGTRHLTTSRPLGEAILSGPHACELASVEDTLLLWMRGHDVAHGAVLPTTTRSWRLDLGHQQFMMLQEAVADVFGFLLAASRAWQQIGVYDLVDLSATFMAELLHYLRRGPWLYGDSGAAHLELDFLIAGGYVELAGAGSEVTWAPDALVAGLTALGRVLAETVVGADNAGPARTLLSDHGWHEGARCSDLIHTLRNELAYIPTAVAYADTAGASKSQ